ncbi:hypothetical protein C0J52_21805 [Blattella germanica]|nr:hypothetical protein C0J52_21805 [Blattella germanica]
MSQNLCYIQTATFEEIAMSVCWIPASNGGVPPGASQAGQDKDGGKIFVGRAFHGTEVLCHGSIAWAPSRDGHVPQEALPVGYTSEGETLYAGRAFHDGTLTVGKVHPSHGVCYIPYGGQEIAYKEYEILITHLCH